MGRLGALRGGKLGLFVCGVLLINGFLVDLWSFGGLR